MPLLLVGILQSLSVTARGYCRRPVLLQKVARILMPPVRDLRTSALRLINTVAYSGLLLPYFGTHSQARVISLSVPPLCESARCFQSSCRRSLRICLATQLKALNDTSYVYKLAFFGCLLSGSKMLLSNFGRGFLTWNVVPTRGCNASASTKKLRSTPGTVMAEVRALIAAYLYPKKTIFLIEIIISEEDGNLLRSIVYGWKRKPRQTYER